MSFALRLPAFVGLLLLALAGGSCTRAPSPVGTWVLDAEALEQLPEIRALKGEKRSQALSLARKMMGEVEVVLGDDGAFRQTFAGRTLSGRYTLGERKGRVVELRVTPTGQPERVLSFELVDDRHARMTTPDGATLVLVRR